MSVNDRDPSLIGNLGVEHAGVANPTKSSSSSNPVETNFVNDPATNETGAGAGANFAGGQQAQRNFRDSAGVVEGRPGIIESSNIDPLNENSNKDDGWANTRTGGTGIGGAASAAVNTASSAAATAATIATGAARMAYGHVAGDGATKQAGKEAVWGTE